jgi:Family of unknown function (DUF6519)
MPAMTGDYSRFTFDKIKRYSGLRQQQGRVQLDADWNEAVAIVKRRVRLQALDTFGPVGVAQLTTPDAFLVSVVAGPPLDLALKPGRIYVDGILAELFDDETASYRNQPFFPDPPLLTPGDAVVYLDLWEREVTYIEDPALLEPALGGIDTTTRTQSIWQLKVDPRPGATCAMPVGAPASAGRLSSEAIAPPTPDDACILPPVAGYRGLENRLYRIEVHNGGPLGTARFKWSRDNGSVVSVVSDIAVAGGQTTLTVNRLKRDQVLRFVVGNWVTVTDDFRELAGEPGEMARIISIDEANAKLVLDRGLPSSGGRAFGGNAIELANRHTRVQRSDQSAPAVDADGLIATAPGPIDVEEGIRVSFSVDPVGGVFNDGDYWVFWARTATASIEVLNAAPPRGIRHHYAQLAAVTGLGGTSATATDCRPTPPQTGEQCCCTFVVAPGQDIQKAIDSLPPAGGCVCLKTGLHLISQTLTIERSNVRLAGESPGTTVLVRAALPALMIGLRTAVQDIVVSGISFERDLAGNGGAVIEIGNAIRVSIEDCVASSSDPTLVVGVSVQNAQQLSIARCIIEKLEMGIWVLGKNNSALAFVDNFFGLQVKVPSRPGFGILAQQVQSMLRIEGNVINGAPNGILINDAALTDPPTSSTQGAEIVDNWVSIVAVPPDGAVAPPAFGIDSAASAARISGNSVLLPEEGTGDKTGLRLTGSDLQATGNTVQLPGERRNSGSVGIQLGHSPSGSTRDVAVSGNEIVGCALGINGSAISGADISGNLLEAGPSRGPTVVTIGIALSGCIGVGVHDNRAVGFSISIGSNDGVANRFAGNIVATGNAGMLLTAETTPVVAQNRITDMQQLGIGAGALIARCDVTDNRIAACGYVTGTGSVPSSIAITGIQGELHIARNEIIDTGVPLAGFPIAPVYGIHAIGVQEATIEGNEVTYTDPRKRDASAEDRALLIQGLSEVDTSIQILGNKFVGAGRSALVELLEKPPNGASLGFERVFFSNNYCRHFDNSAPPLPVNAATVRLTGRAATVVGNQIKSSDRVFPSFDLRNMLGPFMGNVISGPVTRLTPEFPAPIGAFNLTFTF